MPCMPISNTYTRQQINNNYLTNTIKLAINISAIILILALILLNVHNIKSIADGKRQQHGLVIHTINPVESSTRPRISISIHSSNLCQSITITLQAQMSSLYHIHLMQILSKYSSFESSLRYQSMEKGDQCKSNEGVG